jgi:hypothetical protein
MPTKSTQRVNAITAPLPEVVDLLKLRVDELPANDRQFAYSLLGAAAGRGLTIKQSTWVRKMADRIINPVAPREAVQIGDVAGLHVLFDKATQSGLQWPKLRAITESGVVLRIHRAGEKSKHVGQIMVTEKLADGNLYYGRVDREGTFHPSQKVSAEQLAAATPALVAMATDPAAAGKAYGARTGHCAFCALALEDGRSVEVGYGPVCAENFGLPWGNGKQRRAKARR